MHTALKAETLLLILRTPQNAHDAKFMPSPWAAEVVGFSFCELRLESRHLGGVQVTGRVAQSKASSRGS